MGLDDVINDDTVRVTYYICTDFIMMDVFRRTILNLPCSQRDDSAQLNSDSKPFELLLS